MKHIIKVVVLVSVLCLCFTACDYNTDIKTQNKTNVTTSNNSISTENIALPCDSYSCVGKQYNDVVSLFENAGFTNVKAIAQKGESKKETRVNNSVIIVSVDDNVVFSKGPSCRRDAEIKVYYIVSQISQTSESKNYTTSEIAASTPNQNSESSDNETNTNCVWVSESGEKYHSKSNCGGMKNASQILKEEAE